MIHLEVGEKIIREIRRHWFIMFIKAVKAVGIAVLPLLAVIGMYLIANLELLDTEIKITRQMWSLFISGYSLWLLLAWIFFFREWTDYYLDVWYITPKRIIDVEQRSLFNREVISLRYEQLQDATVDVAGILPTLLGYGDVHVQTAGHGREIILKDASDPVEVKKEIMKLHAQATERVREVRIATDEAPKHESTPESNQN